MFFILSIADKNKEGVVTCLKSLYKVEEGRLSIFNSPYFNFKQEDGYTDYTSLYFLLICMKYIGIDMSKDDIECLLNNFKQTDVCTLELTALYCYVATASMLEYQITNKQKEWISEYIDSLSCYDGGYGFFKDTESHGSSTFCALAIITTLSLKLDKPRTVHWLVNRQGEIGFTVS